nr:unnamed protein product [Digitaria exilis]
MDAAADDDSASPTMADDQLQAAESSTEPPPFTTMLRDFSHVLSHFTHFLPSSPSRRLPVHHQLRHGGDHFDLVLVGFMRGGVWYNRDGEPVVDDDGAYSNGGFGAVPASEEAIAALPETTVGECDGETREKEAECVVCLEDYQAGDKLRTMPCSHGFHERCILPWLRVSRLCPLCRFALPAAAAETESLVDEEEDDDEGDTLEEDVNDGDGDTLESIQFLFL